MRDSAGPNMGSRGTHTAGVSPIGSSLTFIKKGEGWQVDAGPKPPHRYQAIASKHTLSQLHGAHVRAGATFDSVQDNHSLDSASEAQLQTVCCESLESFSGTV